MTLPVFEIADDLRAAVAGGDRSRVLLKAPTGSGKSTAAASLAFLGQTWWAIDAAMASLDEIRFDARLRG